MDVLFELSEGLSIISRIIRSIGMRIDTRITQDEEGDEGEKGEKGEKCEEGEKDEKDEKDEEDEEDEEDTGHTTFLFVVGN